MDRLQFEVPVRIAPAPGMPVEEIYSVEQALDVLHEWPKKRQGKVYEAAFNACFGATVDVVKTSPVPAVAATRAPMCTARPRI